MTRLSFFVVAATGTLGDTLPFIAVGNELIRRGHEVAFVSNPAFEQKAREASLSFVPVGTVEEYREFIQDRDLWDRDTVVKTVVKYWLHRQQDYYQAIVRLTRPGETVLFSSPGFLAAQMAQEKFDIPLAAGLVAPSRLRSRFDPGHPSRPFPRWTDPVVRSRLGLRLLYALRRAARGQKSIPGSVRAVLPELQRLRLLAGLPERPASSVALEPGLFLCFWPSWFSPLQKDRPQAAKTTGFPFYPKPEGPRAEGGEGPHDDSGPILFTRGSAASHQRSFFYVATECCRLLQRRGVLVTPHQDDVPRELPPNVTHVPFAPFEKLFAGASAVVHHGGIGTIAYALAAGTPQIAVPIVGEQFDLGYRMERLGVGSMLTRTPLTPARLARQLDSLLRSERIRGRCRTLRPRVDPGAGCSLAAEWIEHLVSNRSAVRAAI